jgi:hypothetical protein
MSPLVVIPLRRGINEPVVVGHKVIIRTLPLGKNLISVKKGEMTKAVEEFDILRKSI